MPVKTLLPSALLALGGCSESATPVAETEATVAKISVYEAAVATGAKVTGRETPVANLLRFWNSSHSNPA